MNRKQLIWFAAVSLVMLALWRLPRQHPLPGQGDAVSVRSGMETQVPAERKPGRAGLAVVNEPARSSGAASSSAVVGNPPAAAAIPAVPASATQVGTLRPPVVPVAGEDAPIDFARHYVIINGHKAHPTRLLAKFSPQADEKGAGESLAKIQYAAFSSPLNRSGLLQLDSTDRQPTEVESAEEARKKGEAVQARIKALLASGQFQYVEPDYIVSANLQPTDAAFVDGTLWGLRNAGQSGGVLGADIDAVRAWNLTTGSTNVIVAIIDTGIRYTHRDLAAQMWRNPQEIAGNGVDDDGNGYIDDVFGINAITATGNPMDDNDHGTHCAGTIGAAANDGNPHVGVAWQVQLMACKFLSASGNGSLSHAIRCIDYAVAKRARILSNSWGGGGFTQALFDSIRAARDQGVIFIAAAGNDGSNNDVAPHYPSNYDLDNVVSVAAIDRLDKLASFSNFGARTVHLGAPGVQIYSSTRGSDTAYASFNGTSMATPHVSGVAALVLARFPAIGYAELKQRLLNTVVPTTDLQGRTTSGGRVNAYNALNTAPDGILEVAVEATPSPLRGAQTAVFKVNVTDLAPVTNATVTANIAALATNLVFLNNGVAPDAAANDQFYTASVITPGGITNLTLVVTVAAPGKTTAVLSNSFSVQSPPANDLFASRAALTGTNATATGLNVGAARETGEPTHAGVGGGRSVWWTWTATGNGPVTVRTAGSTFDTVLAVYTGSAVNALTQIGANDDAGSSLQSQVIFNAVSGTTYQIAVDGYDTAVGNISLSLTASAGGGTPPANDNFASRIAIPGATNSVSGATDNATKEPGEPNHAGNPGGRSAWWSWTAPSNGLYTVHTAGSAFDTLLAVYTGSAVNALTEVASNDNAGGALQSHVTFSAQSGTSYQIAVDGSGGAFGRVQLSVGPAVLTLPPANDSFASRLTLTGTNATGTVVTTAATKETGEPDHAGNSGGRSVWWTWTAPAAGTLTLTTAGSGFNTLLAVYTGSAVGSLTPVVSNNNDPGGGLTSRVVFSVASGQTYQVAVDGNNDGLGAASGTVVINLAFGSAPAAPANDNFANRVILTGATNSSTGGNLGATRETGEPAHAGSGGGHSVWWKWTAPTSASVTIRTTGSSFDTVLAVYTGAAVSNLTQVAANDDAGSTLQSSVTFLATAGTEYQVAVDGYGIAVGSVQLFIEQAPPPPAISLATALDTTNLVWSTGGNAAWAGTNAVTHDGVDAAQSGLIGHSQSSYFETTVVGPGVLTFWWKVSSEAGYDHLGLNLDGTPLISISGEVNWQQRTQSVGVGTHTLRWVYSKDGSVVAGQDRAWVDTVSYLPISVLPPVITGQPAGAFVSAGSTVSFTVTATGTLLQYQWRKNATNLANGGNVLGATSATLSLGGVQTNDAGNYSVVVSNAGGSVTSSNAPLGVASLIVMPLTNGVGVVGLGGASNSVSYYVIAVPAAQTNLTFDLSDGTGDCDLYVRFGSLPSFTDFDYRPYLPGNVESVSVTNPAAGNWYVMLHAYESYSGARLLARHSTGTSGGGVFFDDFEPGIDLPLWSAFGGTVGTTVRATNYGGSVSGVNSLWFGDGGTRHATTRPLDTSPGGVISFSLRLASGSSSPWEQVDALPAEGVVLECSVNGGTTWTELGRYANTTYYAWTPVTLSIPSGARAASTLLRWRQLAHSGAVYDHWALDDVRVDTSGGGVTPPPGSTVAVFDHPSFVDTGGGSAAESDNVQASLQSLGYSVITFTNFSTGISGQQVVLVPELETGDLASALSVAERTALQGFVAGGGTLIVQSGFTTARAAGLINALLGSSVSEQSESDGTVFQRTGAAAGTPFGDDPSTLAALNGSSVLLTASLPGGAVGIYTNGTRSVVAVLPQGSGRIVFLGWDWYNAAPVGTQNGGWLTVLQSAVSLAGPNTNPPSILVQPASQTVTVGASVTFTVAAAGASPLVYQWRKDGSAISGATASSYTIANVQPGDAGTNYSVVVANSFGSITSSNTTLTVVPVGALDFQILTLGTAGSQIVDHNALTGDDRGGLAVTAARVLVSGDSATASFNAADLSGGVGLGRIHDSLCADLRTETAYLLGNGTTPLSSFGGTVTTLLQLDAVTGQTNGTVILLSQSIPMTTGGIFSGYGRVVLHNGSRVYDIALPSGVVTDRGAMLMPQWSGSESWAVWGVAEFFSGTLHLTYARGGTFPITTIERARVPDGAVTPVATFSSLSDLASFTVSPSRGRWYFHYEGSGQFGGTSETLGFAAATFSFASSNVPPTIVSPPASQTVSVGGTASFSVTATGPAPLGYQWWFNGTAITGATNSGHVIAGVTTTHAGSYSVVVSNPYGSTPSSAALLTVSGGASNLVVEAVDSGWYRSDGVHDPVNANYLVGESSSGTGALFYRNWFAFSIPTLPGVITSAHLRLNSFTNSSPDGSENYQLRHVATATATLRAGGTSLPIYADLGDGAVYGTRTVSLSEQGQFISIPLNGEAISNLTAAAGGFFAIGGELTALNPTPNNDESLFGYSNPSSGDIQLVLTFATSPPPPAQVLVFFDDSFRTSPYAQALTNLGVPHQFFGPAQEGAFNTAVQAANPAATLVIVDCPSSLHAFTEVVTFVNAGGRALLQYYDLDASSTLAAAFQVASTVEMTTPSALNDWGGSTLFAGVSSPLNFTDVFFDDGDRLTPAPGGQGVAGYSLATSPGQAAIVIGNSGRTIVNGFLLEEASVQAQAVQLAANEIQFLMGGPPTGTPPSIVSQPVPQSVVAGGAVTFSVAASGSAPLGYQWRFNSTDIPGATSTNYGIASVQTNHAGGYSVVVSNPYGSSTSSIAPLMVLPALTLGEAVDAPLLTWGTGGTTPWLAQVSVTHDAVDAAASGAIGHSQESWMETTVTGPGTLTFWWKVSSEGGFDYLSLNLDGASQFAISGEVNWEQRSLVIGSGAHVLRWRYSKDGSVASGADKAWLDQVSYVPVTNTLHHFAWSAIGGTQVVGVPFPVTITAQDALNNPIPAFSGTVTLTGLVGGGTTSDLLGSPVHTHSSSGNWTLGYAFTPAANLTVTHVRHYFGTKVSIWTDTGTLLAAQNVTSTPGTWVETALATPLQLTAGVRYRVGTFTAGGSYYWREDPGTSFPHGTLASGGLEVSGDAFPTSVDNARWFVSLRYAVGASLPAPVTPAMSGNFVGGTWSGSVTVPQPATSMVLQADDGVGHLGVSAGFAVVTNISTNLPPTVSLTSPVNGASFLAPATITLNATASDPDGTVAKVEFYRAGLKIGEDTASPYALTVSGVAAGAYDYSAVATDSAGDRSLPSSVSVTVTNGVVTGRVFRVASTSGFAGDTVTLPVELVAQGNENAFGFSINFATNQLAFLGAVAGSNALGMQFNVNTNQAGSGRVGLAAALPFGTAFSAATQQVAQLTFRVSTGLVAGASAPVTFGDLPIAREVSDSAANIVTAAYVDGEVGVVAFTGFEGDVAPRPGGNGTVSITDWVQVGRFVSGVDSPSSASEFQRADCAPRSGLGNGVLSITDWVQAGRYAAGLDPLTPAGGPTGAGVTSVAGVTKPTPGQVTGLAARTVRIVGGALAPGQTNTVVVQLVAAGDENSLGFSFSFNPSVWTFVQAVAGTGAGTALFNVNTNQAVSGGRVGIAVSLPAGSAFPAGLVEMARITLVAAAEAGSTTITFGDQPVVREISDAVAQPLTDVTYEDGTFAVGVGPVITAQPQSVVTNHGATATFGVTATGGGLSYQWRRNGLGLPGQNSSNLVLAGVNRSHSGLYSVEVSNGGGSVVSSNAALRVIVPQRIEPPVRIPDGRFRFLFGDHDGGLLSITNLATLEVQVSTNFVGWSTLTNGVTVSNGQFFLDDAGATGAVRRFYRIIER